VQSCQCRIHFSGHGGQFGFETVESFAGFPQSLAGVAIGGSVHVNGFTQACQLLADVRHSFVGCCNLRAKLLLKGADSSHLFADRVNATVKLACQLCLQVFCLAGEGNFLCALYAGDLAVQSCN